ncbi:MAG: acyltransferase [Verrucomicrobia bacterium]|nr:acyltransferase [Verrucomicrobiota bacterium]
MSTDTEPHPPSGAASRGRSGVRLGDLQSLRGIAALMVVLFHAGEIFKERFGAAWMGNVFRAGFVGVDVFFVISGFIILWVHQGDAGRPSSVRPYAIKRALRIFPLYWTVVLLKAAKDFAHLDPVVVACAFLLIPYPLPPFINLSWTLTFEMVFYVSFVAVLLMGLRRGLAVVAAVMLGLAFLPRPFPDDGSVHATAVNFLFDQHVLGFLAGLAAAWALRRWTIPRPHWFALAGAGAFLVSLGLTTWTGVTADHAVLSHPAIRHTSLCFGVPTALLLVGLVGRELSGGRPVLGAFRRIGEWSYSLYLLHGFLIYNLTGIEPFRGALARHPMLLWLPVLSTLVAAAAAYRCIEKPCVDLGRRWAGAPERG